MSDETPETPQRGRGKGRKKPPGWKAVFLQTLRDSAIVRTACEAAGVSRATAYRERNSCETFANAWDIAIEDACDLLHVEAVRRAMKGTKRPVFQGGKRVGYVREYSDQLLIFLLKAHRPELFRESVSSERIVKEIAEAMIASKPAPPPSNGQRR